MDARRSPSTRRWLLASVVALATRAPAAQARDDHAPPAHLRDTGLYASWADKTVAAANLPFTPQYPLWSDGASKRRWIQIPRGKWIDATRRDAWEFPVGTRLWKEFSFGRRVETRYMQRLGDGSWLYATYVWSDDGSDAVLAPERGIASSHAIRPGVTHSVPGSADCRACHEGRATPVLGFDALQLSPDRDPLAPHAEPARPDDLDLPALARRRLVRGLPARWLAEPPRVDAPSPTARAAVGYLHANCGGCHNSSGPLAELGLSLAYGADAGDEPPAAVRTTVGAPARFRMPGAPGAETTRIVAGRPEASLLLARMSSRHPLLQMPPLGTRLVDDQAVALLERWITEDLSMPKNPTTDKETTP